MENLQFIYTAVFKMMCIPIYLFGYEFTLFQLSIFSIVSGMFIYFVRGVFD